MRKLAGNAKIVAISPDRVDQVNMMMQHIKEKSGEEMTGILLLSDADHKVIDSYGLLNETAAARGRFLPHPTTYVLDSKGIVRWKFTEKDYKIRPTNAAILDALEKLR